MINAIFAIDEEGGMGLQGMMPWPTNSQDLAWFKMHTVGHIVVMGRSTWEAKDMPKPLPRRTNWVITSGTIEPNLSGAHVWHKHPVRLVYKLARENPNKIVWVIGGAKLLTSLAGIFDRLYVTHIASNFGCDVKLNFTEFANGYKEIYNSSYLDMDHIIYEKLS